MNRANNFEIFDRSGSWNLSFVSSHGVSNPPYYVGYSFYGGVIYDSRGKWSSPADK